MREQILSALGEIENEHNVSILFACESGSRAWGFASQDSDYDVRFIYKHPRDWYLSIDQGRDVIERQLPGDLDVSGWELRKALGLYRKSNPPLLEWLRSPIIYFKDDLFLDAMRAVPWNPSVGFEDEWGFSPKSCLKHYYSMARGNTRNYFDADEVPLKKYLYVLRPILACQWIEQRLSLPPVEFGILVKAMVTDELLRSMISDLLKRKASGVELGKGPKIEYIHEFVEREMLRLAKLTDLPESKPSTDGLNRLFVGAIGF